VPWCLARVFLFISQTFFTYGDHMRFQLHPRTSALVFASLVGLATTPPLWAAALKQATKQIKADNSAVNVRDQSVHEVTAQDQSISPKAADTLRIIRARLTTDETLSTYAKNIKIIVIDDLITLKGPVRSDAEKLQIVRIANNAAPEYKIENQIEVVKK
jgi:hyperosmotically inducible periplasmic protein